MFAKVCGKKLLVLGAEASTTNIVAQAKDMGIYTIVTERSGDLSNLPAKKIADEIWDIDYSNIDLLSKKCKQCGVDGVMSGYSDSKVLYAARLSQNLGTPFYVTPVQIEMTRNKRTFKKMCVKHNINVPVEYCKNGKITSEECDNIVYPVIVKPADYGGRIGISVCHNRTELDLAVKIARQKSEADEIVVEEYISGIEFTAIYTIVDGEKSLSIVNDKYLSQEGNKYACLCDVAITPSKYYKLYKETVDAQIQELLQELGVMNGIAGFQGIIANGKITIFEMGLRLNGGNDWKLLAECNGINHMKMLINYSLTGEMGDSLSKDNPELKDYMCTYVVYAHAGEVGFVDYHEIEGQQAIIDISSYVYVGKVIPDYGTTQQRVISFKIRTKHLEELIDKIYFIQTHLRVEDKFGKSLLFSKFDTSRLLY